MTRSRSTHGLSRRRAFSLGEVLVAFLILVVVLIPVVGSLSRGHQGLARMEDLVRFQGLAQQVVVAAGSSDLAELIAREADGDLAAWAREAAGGDDVPDGVRISPVLAPVTGEPRARTLQVRVEWENPSREGRKIRYQTTLTRLLFAPGASLTRSLEI